jgi:hypothetical protein
MTQAHATDVEILREALNAFASSTRSTIRHNEWERNRWHEMAELDTDTEGQKRRLHEHAEMYDGLIEEDRAKLARIEAARGAL